MRLLITAGPTREPIDPVRFLSNRSSGKMGFAIAEAALEAGDEVILVSGPVSIGAPAGARLINVTTSDEMFEAVHANLEGVDLAVLCAAVADFKPARCEPRKIKKSAGSPRLELVPTRDILASLGAMRPRNFFLAGFAAETNDVAENARKKLLEKGCDAIVANDVSRADLGFESDENELTVFIPDRSSIVLPKAKKLDLARALLIALKKFQEII